MLDFALRVGFEMRLCRPYSAQTKGKVENGVKYVRRNLWPTVRFSDDAEMNRQGMEWCERMANERVHGTTMQRPKALLARERAHILALPERFGLGAVSSRGAEGGTRRLRALGRCVVRRTVVVTCPQ